MKRYEVLVYSETGEELEHKPFRAYYYASRYAARIKKVHPEYMVILQYVNDEEIVDDEVIREGT